MNAALTFGVLLLLAVLYQADRLEKLYRDTHVAPKCQEAK